MVDSHHHFWDPGRFDYPWLAGAELAPIRRRFGPEDLQPLLSEAGVERTVLVQTISDLEETSEFLAVAERTEFVAGVVGWADLTDPRLAEVLRGLQAGPGGGHLVGIRHQVHDEADPHWLLLPDVQRGIAAVGDAGLVYDLLVRTRELPAAVETARRHPQVSFVLDHLAKPRIAGERFDGSWSEALAPLAELPNVSCKLSGMVTEAEWSSWKPEDLQPYVERVLDLFGPERCLFGSDWPVCLIAASYSQVLEALRASLAGLGEDARAGVLGGNASRLYRLS